MNQELMTKKGLILAKMDTKQCLSSQLMPMKHFTREG